MSEKEISEADWQRMNAPDYEEQPPEPDDVRLGLPVPAKVVPPAPPMESPASSEPVKTPAQHRDDAVSGILREAYARASTLKITETEAAALAAPFPDESVEIRPHDGLLYLPHILVGQRLHSVFGPGQWCMVRRSQYIQGTNVMAEWVMLVRGCFVGESLSGHPYNPTNPKMDYGDSLEATRAIALRRIAARDLNCGSILWNPEYCRKWQDVHAEQYPNPDSFSAKRTPKLWRKKAPPATESFAAPVAAPAPAKHDAKVRPEDYQQKCKERFLKLAAPVEFAAWRLWIRLGLILPVETLADAPALSFPQNKESFESIMEKVRAIADEPEDEEYAVDLELFKKAKETSIEAAGKASMKGNPKAEQPALIPNADPEAWRNTPVPNWSKHCDKPGKKFGDLTKNQLWWWCVQWQPKPWTDEHGQEKPPGAKDMALRKMLDEVKAKYKFTEAEGQ